LAEEQRLKFSY